MPWPPNTAITVTRPLPSSGACFSILGSLTPASVARLACEEHVYVAPDGRINLAGLPEAAAGRGRGRRASRRALNDV
jgi:hypothetical protein